MGVQSSRSFQIIGLVTFLVFLPGCGGDEGQGGNVDGSSTSGVSNAIASESAPAGPVDNCPLTAAEVSDVVGTAVQQDSMVCMFEPEPGTNPTVLYVRQVSFACSEAMVNDPEFDYVPFEGLGVKAYTSPTSSDLLVCTNPPFEITVDITLSLDVIVADPEAADATARASERAAAEQLARLILDK